MDDAAGWGIEALHRAIDGVAATSAVHICYGYGIPANIEWKATLGNEWRQYEKFFPALANSRIDQVSLECIHSHVPLSMLELLDGKDVFLGVIDVATEEIETPEEVAAVILQATDHVPKEKIVGCTNCGMAPMRRDTAEKKLKRWRRARRWRAHGSAKHPKLYRSLRERTSINSPTLRRCSLAGGDRVLDAMGHMVGEDFVFGASQRGAHRRQRAMPRGNLKSAKQCHPG